MTVPIAHRRFTEWAKAGRWPRLHRAVVDELRFQRMIDWSRAVCDAASVRPKKGIHDRPNPVDRGTPAKPHADKAYDQAELRTWVARRGIAVHIARRGIESSQKLGKHRWIIERSIA